MRKSFRWTETVQDGRGRKDGEIKAERNRCCEQRQTDRDEGNAKEGGLEGRWR